MLSLPELIACVGRDWWPRISDPHLMGWLTVVVYLLTAALGARVVMRLHGLARAPRVFWILLTALLLALAVNKQLDLQTALTAAGRCQAMAGGWYDDRRPVQIGFLFALGALAIWAGIEGARALHGHLVQHGLALAGLVFVLAFVMMRAVSFHGMDRLIGLTVAGLRANWVLELTGPALIIVNAWLLLRAARGDGSGNR